MKTVSVIIFCLLLFLAMPAPAGIISFTGAWTTTVTNGGDGTVDTTGVPIFITITGSNNSLYYSVTSFTTTALSDDLIGFYWLYQSFDQDDPSYDPGGYVIDGVQTELSSDSGPSTQSGYATLPVSAGQVFGFYIDATDGCCGPGVLTISSEGLASIPEPSTLVLLGGGLLALGLFRRRRK